MAEKRGKILVVRGGAIGDFILTLPAIAALRSTFPDTHLEVLGYPNVAELARAGGLIDAFRSIEAGPLSRFFARNAKLDPAWMEYFESFNLIISYLYDPDQIFKTNVGRSTKAQFIQAQHRPDEKLDLHATAVFLKPLEQLAIFNPDPTPRLPVGRGSVERGCCPASLETPNQNPCPFADTPLAPTRYIAIHPGSGSERKNWPIQHWLTLVQRLQATTDLHILLIGGEAEGTRLDELAPAISPQRLRRAERLPLADLASLLAQSALFIGHDSGITHLAAAVNCPIIALWGPTRRPIWQPLSDRVHIIESPAADLQQLLAGTVLASVLELLGSSVSPDTPTN